MPEIVRATAGDAALIRGDADSRRYRDARLRRRLARAIRTLDVYFDAFADLNRSDIVAVALTLGVLLFAVVSAIMLVRTRLRAATSRRRVSATRSWRSRPSATASTRC